MLLSHFSHRLRSSLQVRVQDLLLSRRVDNIWGFLVSRHIHFGLIWRYGRGIYPFGLALVVAHKHWANHCCVVDRGPSSTQVHGCTSDGSTNYMSFLLRSSPRPKSCWSLLCHLVLEPVLILDLVIEKDVAKQVVVHKLLPVRQIVAIRHRRRLDTRIRSNFAEAFSLTGDSWSTINALGAVDFILEGTTTTFCIQTPVWLNREDGRRVFRPRHDLSLTILASHTRSHILFTPWNIFLRHWSCRCLSLRRTRDHISTS